MIDDLKDIVGTSYVITTDSQRLMYETDQRHGHIGKAKAVILPETTEQVVAVMRYCHKHRIAVVPQGGNTGLVGGSVPDDKGAAVVINLSRLNRIREYNVPERLVIAEAGVTQKHLIDMAEQDELVFPIDLGARDSCQIGGNISTNAGGLQVLKYGMTRASVRGLEVVLPNGDLFTDLRALQKDNTGYALRELFIGSEGSLGIITAAAISLYPALPEQETLFAALPSVKAATTILEQLERRFPDRLSSAELMPRLGMELALKHVDGARDPFESSHPWYALFEVSFPRGENRRDDLIEALEDMDINDAVLAENLDQRNAFWNLRESLNHCQRLEGYYFAHDVGVRRSVLNDIIAKAEEEAPAHLAGIRPLIYGHIGDGSLHLNLLKPQGMDDQQFARDGKKASDYVYHLIETFEGTFSAEHGVGADKREHLIHSKDPVTLSLMRQIKTMFDPHNLMNPGKVV